tara:strand:+ start:1519 stop:1794 length:276 start_codon:yes stop_codon:yes gene_type:complete
LTVFFNLAANQLSRFIVDTILANSGIDSEHFSLGREFDHVTDFPIVDPSILASARALGYRVIYRWDFNPAFKNRHFMFLIYELIEVIPYYS